MPLNERKIISIILEQCSELPERCNGYRAAVVDAIVDIIRAERQHRVAGTNIQQRITDKCNATAEHLVRHQPGGRTSNS